MPLATALRNAVREDRVGHAYLFTGPRGTGKTSTARILAKALNCEAPDDGEPCGTCGSCLAVEAGTSLDVHELDAASNRRVEDMRELVGRVSLGTAGRTKLYILDEVHMLTADASNTLLKTLEEPPAHVVFVLATTEPEKVLPTIRSRTQHFEFRLLSAGLLEEHLGWVAADAGLEVDSDTIEHAVRRGAGSARDALSALDQVVAAGMAVDDGAAIDELIEALCERDTGRALRAIAAAAAAGREPRLLAEALLAQLRESFLAIMAPELVSLPDRAAERVADQGRRLGPPAVVRALDGLGEVLVAMREAPDTRVCLEAALVRLTRPELDTSPAALLERLERLERAARAGGAATRAASHDTEPAAASGEPVPSPGAAAVDSEGERPAAASRAALGAVRKSAGRPARSEGTSGRSSPPAGEAPPAAAPAPAPPAGEPAPAPPPPAAATSGPAPAAPGMPTRDELTLAWGDAVLPSLRPKVKALYSSGRFTAVDGDTALFSLPNEPTRVKGEELRPQVEKALSEHFGHPVAVRLVVGGEEAGTGAGSDPADPAGADDDVGPVHELEDAPSDTLSGAERVAAAFPGAEIVEE